MIGRFIFLKPPNKIRFFFVGFPCGSAGKESTCIVGDLSSTPGFNPSVGKIPWRKERLPTSVFWPGEFQGVAKVSDFHFFVKYRLRASLREQEAGTELDTQSIQHRFPPSTSAFLAIIRNKNHNYSLWATQKLWRNPCLLISLLPFPLPFSSFLLSFLPFLFSHHMQSAPCPSSGNKYIYPIWRFSISHLLLWIVRYFIIHYVAFFA